MVNFSEVLNKAIASQKSRPNSELVVEALLSAEKVNHQQKIKYQFEQLIGDWRLSFITGTKNSRQRFANLIGAGFYLPPLVKISISYNKVQDDHNHLPETESQGTVKNQVQVGLVQFSLTGPIKYIAKKNIIAFDFTSLALSVLGIKVFATDVRGGVKSHQDFYQNSIRTQAFFSYFLVSDNLIAARGRGGGLALWQKMKS